MRFLTTNAASQPIKNFVQNPQAAVSTTGYIFHATNAPGVTSSVSGGGPFSRSFARRTMNAIFSPTAGTDLFQLADTSWVSIFGPTVGGSCGVTPGKQYVVSAFVRVSQAVNLRISLEFIKDATSALGSTSTSDITVAANTWTRLSHVGTAGVDAQALRLDIDAGAGITWANGDTMDVTALMITEGSNLYPFSDGNSDAWNWVGTPGASESLAWPVVVNRNYVQRHKSFGPDGLPWEHNTNLGSFVTATEVADSIAGTGITRAMDFDIPANAGYTWNVVQMPHNVKIKKGDKWTWSFWYKNLSGTYSTITPSLRKSDTTNSIMDSLPGSFSTSATWTRKVYVFTATADAIYVGEDNAGGNNLMHFSVLSEVSSAHFRMAGFSLEPGDKSSFPYSPPYYPDANGGLYNSGIELVYNGGNYNDTVHVGDFLDGGRP